MGDAGCCMLLPYPPLVLLVAAEVPKYSQRLKGSESPPRERRRVSPRPAPQKAPGWTARRRDGETARCRVTSCEACVMTGDVGVRWCAANVQMKVEL